MTPSSSELPKQPVTVEHLDCGAIWEIYAIEWPPKVVVCTHCMIGLQLVGHDKPSNRLAYRRI